MNGDHTQKEPPQAVKPQPLAVFYRALTDVQIECALLVTAIRHHDPESARIAAEDAVSSYLVAMAALRRLESRTTEDDEVRAARLAFKEARTMLDSVFERALAQIATQSLHRLLQQLSLSLLIANDECPSGNIGTR
jgi:hypothetical protein